MRNRIETVSQWTATCMVGILATGCVSAPPAKPGIARARYLMGTICEIETPVSPSAETWVESGFKEIGRVEQLLSTWNENSELSRLNRAPVAVPQSATPELIDLLFEAMSWRRRTSDAFNPLIRPLIEAWKTRGEGTLPDRSVISRAISRMAAGHIEIDRTAGTITRHADAQFEEGGFAKGYAIDRALDEMRRAGAPSAVIDFGGQIGLYGFSKGLEVAIADPERRDAPAVMLRLHRGSISTSSGSERTFRVGTRVFSHLIDPRTGLALPPRGSVSVIADRALVADILSTALYVLGPDDGLAWADREGIAAIFLVPGEAGTHYSLRRSEAARSLALRALDPRFSISM